MENGEKFLSIYDGYRAYMPVQVLKMFDSHGIIAYAPLSHTLGLTQSLDLVEFSVVLS